MPDDTGSAFYLKKRRMSQRIQVSPEFDRFYNAGRAAYEASNYPCAVENFNYILPRNPAGNHYVCENPLIVVRRERSFLIAPTDDYIICCHMRACSYRELKNFHQVIIDLSEILKFNITPLERSEMLRKRGLAYGEMQDYDQAIIDLTEALYIEPQSAPLYYYRSIAYRLYGKFNEALKDAAEAIRLDPINPQLHANRSNIYNAIC